MARNIWIGQHHLNIETIFCFWPCGHSQNFNQLLVCWVNKLMNVLNIELVFIENVKCELAKTELVVTLSNILVT